MLCWSLWAFRNRSWPHRSLMIIKLIILLYIWWCIFSYCSWSLFQVKSWIVWLSSTLELTIILRLVLISHLVLGSWLSFLCRRRNILRLLLIHTGWNSSSFGLLGKQNLMRWLWRVLRLLLMLIVNNLLKDIACSALMILNPIFT